MKNVILFFIFISFSSTAFACAGWDDCDICSKKNAVEVMKWAFGKIEEPNPCASNCPSMVFGSVGTITAGGWTSEPVVRKSDDLRSQAKDIETQEDQYNKMQEFINKCDN